MSAPSERRIRLAFWVIAIMADYHNAIDKLISEFGLSDIEKIRLKKALKTAHEGPTKYRIQRSKFTSSKIGNKISSSIQLDPLKFMDTLNLALSDDVMAYELQRDYLLFQNAKSTIRSLFQ